MRSQQETLIKEAQDILSKAKAKSAKARNSREADAVERELEAARRTIREREAERDKLTQAIAQVTESLAKHEEEFQGLRAHLQQKDEEAQKAMAELEAQRNIALAGRDQLAVKVPPAVLKRYDALRGRRGTGTAIARDGTCLGCRLSLRPMQYIVVQRSQSIEACPQCGRFLVLAEHFGEEQAALEAGEAAPSEEPGSEH